MMPEIAKKAVAAPKEDTRLGSAVGRVKWVVRLGNNRFQ